MELKNNLFSDTGWEIYENTLEPEKLINRGSIFMVGNGYLGYRGTFAEADKDEYQACIVSDTYDKADDKWRELCNVPNGLQVKFSLDNELFSNYEAELNNYQRKIDFKKGIFSYKSEANIAGQNINLSVERFSSYENKHLLVQRHIIEFTEEANFSLELAIEGELWSLNGDHFKDYQPGVMDEGELKFSTTTQEREIAIEVIQDYQLNQKPQAEKIITKERKVAKELTYQVTAGDKLVLDLFTTIYTSNDLANPKKAALDLNRRAQKKGFQTLKTEQVKSWAELWDKFDIKITGDLEAQALLRFNIFHNIIATPVHSERLPIGARGLSCQAYQGAAFWDQEIFNLPMFLYSWPEVAKNILLYRYHTLPAAREKAERLGFKGAYYAWISGKTGEELCPDFFFEDVLTGRKIRNHFNDWQIHVSPDIAYTVWKYYQVTGDWDFIVDYGAEIIFSVARFLYSRAYYNPGEERYEFLKLLGPDEYHENVDNNYFTNYQAKHVLDKACKLYQRLEEENLEQLTELKNKISLSSEEVETWAEMADKIYLFQPDPESKLIPQFAGYFALEDVIPEVLEERLQDPREYWGWPIGVAVHTQVIKQADLIQLFVLHDDFREEVIKANYDYYEPRTEHGSSLSPSAYALIACKIGYQEQAYKNFLKSCSVDLYSTNKAISGGTFIGGIHTAACGAAWQMIVQGFAGFKYQDRQIIFDPLLPEKWQAVEFNLVVKGNKFKVKLTKNDLNIRAEQSNKSPQDFAVFANEFSLAPGDHRRVNL